MECQICKRPPEAVPGLNCPACARASLYQLRLRHAEVLTDKERLERQVERVINTANSTQQSSTGSAKEQEDLSDCVKTFSHANDFAELLAARERIDTIVKHTATLQEDLLALKEEVEKRKKQRTKRQADLDEARAALRTRRNDTLTSLKQSNKDRNIRFDRTYSDIVIMRIHNCKRAASLAGLKQVSNSTESARKDVQYHISRLHIPDIRHLNNMAPAHANAVLLGVVRLVNLACGYLQIRLPAEIVLPRSGYPWPSIYAPGSSYVKHEAHSLKKTSPLQSRESSIKNSRELEQRGAGRPRHLSIDKKLSRLAKENSVAYALFIEGVALLAWDIAWLCRTQGLPVAEKNWDDVCDIGKNLWLLFCTPPPEALYGSERRTLRTDPASAIKQARGAAPFSAPLAPAAFGVFSHGSAKNYLDGPKAGNIGVYDVNPRGWVFANPVKIFDELRAALLTEMSGHDWELLDDKESEAGDNTDADETVVVDSKGKDRSSAGTETNERSDGRRGTSGWTKLKSRPTTE